MVNPIKAIKLGIKVGTRSIIDRGIGGKTVNPIYKNGGAPPISNVKVVQSEKQRDAAFWAAQDKDMADAMKQQSKQMFDNMSSGENFSKTKKINTDPARGR